MDEDNERPMPIDDLKEVRRGPSVHQVTKIGTSLTEEEECKLVGQLNRNVNLFP